MLSSPPKLKFSSPLRDVYIRLGNDVVIPEQKLREKMEDRYRQGYDAGQKALSEQLVEQRKQLIDIQHGLLRSIQAALPGVVAECEKSVVLLAIESARKIVDSIPISAEMVEAVVKGALTELQDTASYEVLLHPEDLSLLHALQSGLLPQNDNPNVRFGADPKISRGGCIIRTNHGAITALREKMFEKLATSVLA